MGAKMRRRTLEMMVKLANQGKFHDELSVWWVHSHRYRPFTGDFLAVQALAERQVAR